jgi:peptidoglycan/xylan/chitin deacetylase (PgdA/CDA1 family)
MPYAFARKSSLLVSGLLVIGLLAGCAPAPGSPKSPRASIQEAANASSNSEGQNSDTLPLFLVPDLNAVTATDEHRRIFTKHFEVSSVPAVARSQADLVTEQVDAFKSTNVPDVATGERPVAELNMRSHLTAVSTRVLGIRVNTYESTGAGAGTRYVTQWFTQDAPAALGTRDLFDSDEDWAQFKEFIAQAATADPRVFVGSLLDLDDAWLDSVNFDAHGNALVGFDDNSVGPGSAGPIVVKVVAEHVAALLSGFGTLARTAATSPSPRVQLGLLQDRASQAPEGGAAATSPESVPDAGKESEGADRNRRPQRAVDCTAIKCVALTFDDGPGPKTGKLLDTLREGNAPSTFFVVGPNAKLRPEILARMVAEGHEVGNHTWNHRSLTSLSSAQIQREIDRTNAAIAKAVDQPATLMRPPYGAHNSISDRLASTPVILWDVDTLDWKHRNTEKVVDAAISQTTPGSIVLMHDIHSSTVAAVPKILAGLRAKGYTFVTVTELMGDSALKAGESYARGPQPAKASGAKGAKATR